MTEPWNEKLAAKLDGKWVKEYASSFPGEWIALLKGVLIAHGKRLKDVLEIVDSKNQPRIRFLLFQVGQDEKQI